jgi:hypothetical protein
MGKPLLLSASKRVAPEYLPRAGTTPSSNTKRISEKICRQHQKTCAGKQLSLYLTLMMLVIQTRRIVARKV